VKISVLIRGDHFEFEGEATLEQASLALKDFYDELDDPEQALTRAKARLDASSETLEGAVRDNQQT